VPQFLLRAGFTRMCCTQPRRISAIALARRVSHETLNEHGSEVAFKIRFDSTCGAATRILFLTEVCARPGCPARRPARSARPVALRSIRQHAAGPAPRVWGRGGGTP